VQRSVFCWRVDVGGKYARLSGRTRPLLLLIGALSNRGPPFIARVGTPLTRRAALEAALTAAAVRSGNRPPFNPLSSGIKSLA
jgi:hypothetical protein